MHDDLEWPFLTPEKPRLLTTRCVWTGAKVKRFRGVELNALTALFSQGNSPFSTRRRTTKEAPVAVR
jgi:hypothetical protein